MTAHTLHLLIFMIAAAITLFAARAIGACINRRFLLRATTAIAQRHSHKKIGRN